MKHLRVLLAWIGMAVLWISGPLAVNVSTASAQSAELAASKTFTLQPGGKAVVTYEAFCLDFGKKFPASVNAPQQAADARVQSALYYGLTKAYQTSDPLELQYAIWRVTEAKDAPAGGKVASEVFSATQTLKTPAMVGTSVLDAVKGGQVKLTLDTWQAIGDKVTVGTVTDNFHGRGQLTLENVSQQALTLEMPVGTVFVTPDAESQNMVGYATDVKVTNPALSTSQTLPVTGALNTPVLLLTVVALMMLAASMLIRRSLRV